MDRIYMDYAATTYIKDDVREAMRPYEQACFGNASSLYQSGRDAKSAVENARKEIARGIGAARKNEIYFTSGGTESDNWALVGAMEAGRHRGRHLVTTAAEHHAVLDTCKWLERNGCEVTVLPVDGYGMVSAAQVKRAIRSDTVLVSVIYANNEVGSINPIAAIGEACRQAGVLFHTDAVQAAGALPLDVQRNQVDLLSLSAHKFYGPKGTGLLYIREKTAVRQLLHGGMQEGRMRAGTENVPGIVGMAKAFSLAQEGMPQEAKRLRMLREYMMNSIRAKIPGVKMYGHADRRLPGNVHLSLPGIPSQAALLHLDMAGIECSSGSACTSGSVEPSHVLLAMGIPREEAKCALRFTMGETTTKEQIDVVVGELAVLAGRRKSGAVL